MLTSELKGKKLDRMVALAVGNKMGNPVAYSTSWFATGQLVDKMRISLRQVDDQQFKGKIIIASIEPQYPVKENVPLATGAGWWSGDTPLQAICRCIVASVYGSEVPD